MPVLSINRKNIFMKIRFFLALLILSTGVFAQKATKCAKIFIQTDVQATYRNGEKDITKFYHDAILPILTAYLNVDGGGVIGSLRPRLTINTNGKVMDVKFTDLNILPEFEQKLKVEFLKMEGWKPGKNKKKVVCSTIVLPVYYVSWKRTSTGR